MEMEHKCQAEKCQAHDYMMELIKELRGMSDVLMTGQNDIKANVIKLSENLLEMRRVNERMDLIVKELKETDAKAEAKILKNSDFVNKAVGVIGAISIVAVLASAITGIVTLIINYSN